MVDSVLVQSLDAPPERRTQQQRREGTIAKLIDATIAALAEVGFVRTTVKEICARAGVSDGGLFRHFDTRLDLIVAAAEQLASDTVTFFYRQIDAVQVSAADSSDNHPLVVTIRGIRDATRQPTTRVWHELFAAARTDSELRRRLEPATRRYAADIRGQFAHAPGVEYLSPSQAGLWLALLLHLFDGEAIFYDVTPDPEAEERLLAFVTELVMTSVIAAPAKENESRAAG